MAAPVFSRMRSPLIVAALVSKSNRTSMSTQTAMGRRILTLSRLRPPAYRRCFVTINFPQTQQPSAACQRLLDSSDHCELTPRKRTLTKEPVKTLLLGSHKKDGVSKELTLIYRNNLISTIFGINLCMHPLCAVSFVVGTTNLFEQWQKKDYCDFLTFVQIDVVQTSFCYMAAALAFLLTARGISNRSMIRIYYDEKNNEFVGVCRKRDMISTELMRFKSDDVLARKAGRIMGNFSGNYYVKNRIYVINPVDFRNPYFMNLMVGDVPADTKLEEDDELEEKQGPSVTK